MDNKFRELRDRLIAIDDLRSAARLLSWDQATYMPPRGAAARGRHMATLGQLAHQQFTDGSTGQLLHDLRPYEESLPYDSDEASLIRVTRRAYEKAVKVPASFMAEINTHAAASFAAWTTARPADDFGALRPYLEKTVELSRRFAEYFAPYDHVADPLIDALDEGMTVAALRDLFAKLRERLVPLVHSIAAQQVADDACLRQPFPEAQQMEFADEIIRRYGFDFERGRLDRAPHPFMTRFSTGDVRITTRFLKNDLRQPLFPTLHEAGHALYEQGIRAELEGTPLASGATSGVHESQSRLWENLVGRSHAFWTFFYPRLQATFPDQLGSVSLDSFYRAINKVERSLIRVEADELTYNLHIIMRFDLELALLEGRLPVRDLPEAWRERFKEDFGLAPPDDRDGVMQDMHWYAGVVGGMFQGYTIGNILSAQFYDAACTAHPSIPDEIKAGDFGTLRGWLTQNIYQHGSKFTAPELIERATGGELSIEPYIRYLHGKYGELYTL